jgi:predicted metal-binding protein
MNITLCQSCPLGQSAFRGQLEQALIAAGLQAQVTGVDCMSGCARPSTIAFRSAGKTAYLFGDLAANDLPGLVAFARLYAESTDGNFADARVLGGLRAKAIARIPGDSAANGR